MWYYRLSIGDVASIPGLPTVPINLTLKAKSETTIFTLAYQYQACAQDGTTRLR